MKVKYLVKEDDLKYWITQVPRRFMTIRETENDVLEMWNAVGKQDVRLHVHRLSRSRECFDIEFIWGTGYVRITTENFLYSNSGKPEEGVQRRVIVDNGLRPNDPVKKYKLPQFIKTLMANFLKVAVCYADFGMIESITVTRGDK